MSDIATSEAIDRRIADLGDWRADTLGLIRTLVTSAVPDVDEDLKWAKANNPGVPTWSHGGIICTGEPYKAAVR